MDDLELLHNQIIAWQERRFTVVTGAITLVAVLCGFILSDVKRSWTREQASSLILLVLTCASIFAWYAGWQNAIIGAFLRAIREPDGAKFGWETGAAMLNAKHPIAGFVSLNKIIGLTFALTAIGTISIFYLHSPKQEGSAAKWVFYSTSSMFTLAILLLTFPQILIPNYDVVWRGIKSEYVSKHPSVPSLSPSTVISPLPASPP